MPEGVIGYPRWQGPLSQGPAAPVVVEQEARKALRGLWVQLSFILGLMMAVAFLSRAMATGGTTKTHTLDNFVNFLTTDPWSLPLPLPVLQLSVLAVAALVAGPALLEDARRGAVELYLSRGLKRRDYLLGKALTVFGLTFLAFAGPALLYVLGTFLLFENHPATWAQAPAGVLTYGLMFSFMAAGLGLGLSCVARSGRAAAIILFGTFLVAEVFVSKLLQLLSGEPSFQLLSPLSYLQQQSQWLFGVPPTGTLPPWLGLLGWAVLSLVGWGLVAWKHPRLAGE